MSAELAYACYSVTGSCVLILDFLSGCLFGLDHLGKVQGPRLLCQEAQV